MAKTTHLQRKTLQHLSKLGLTLGDYRDRLFEIKLYLRLLKLVSRGTLAPLMLVYFLAACHSSSPHTDRPQTGEWHSDLEYFREARLLLNDLAQWHYRGKIGLTTDNLREHASLNWQFHDQSNSVRLFGPLGAGAIRIDFDQYAVRLRDNKGGVFLGESAEDLLTDIVGWPLPIDALSHWLFVLPAPEHAFQYRLNQHRQVVSIRQLGWQIDYSAYQQFTDRLLPTKLVAFKQFDSAGPGSVTVKLLAKSWNW